MREVLYWMNCGELTLLLLNLGAQRLSGQTYFKEVSQRTLQSHTDRPITESLFKRWPRPYQHNLGRGELDSRHRDQRLEEVRWSFWSAEIFGTGRKAWPSWSWILQPMLATSSSVSIGRHAASFRCRSCVDIWKSPERALYLWFIRLGARAGLLFRWPSGESSQKMPELLQRIISGAKSIAEVQATMSGPFWEGLGATWHCQQVSFCIPAGPSRKQLVTALLTRSSVPSNVYRLHAQEIRAFARNCLQIGAHFRDCHIRCLIVGYFMVGIEKLRRWVGIFNS